MAHAQWTYVQPPPPTLNGGWFTGEPYAPDAPWRTINVTPDVAFLVHRNLRSADPPPGAVFHYPGSFRPGNNAQSMPGVAPLGRGLDVMCVQQRAPDGGLLQKPAGRFFKYAYLSS